MCHRPVISSPKMSEGLKWRVRKSRKNHDPRYDKSVVKFHYLEMYPFHILFIYFNFQILFHAFFFFFYRIPHAPKCMYRGNNFFRHGQRIYACFTISFLRYFNAPEIFARRHSTSSMRQFRNHATTVINCRLARLVSPAEKLPSGRPTKLVRSRERSTRGKKNPKLRAVSYDRGATVRKTCARKLRFECNWDDTLLPTHVSEQKQFVLRLEHVNGVRNNKFVTKFLFLLLKIELYSRIKNRITFIFILCKTCQSCL